MSRKCVSGLASVLVVLAIAAMAPASLVNYYSFNTGTMTDESALFSQNGGANVTNGTWAAAGAATESYVTGRGMNNMAVGTDKALNIKSGNGFSSAMVLPAGNADLNLGQNFTIEMWVNPNGGYTSQTNSTFITGTNVAITKSGYGDPGTESARIGSTTAAVGSWVQTGWHHIALVANGGIGTFYRDGVATTIGATGVMPVMTTFQIGLASMNGTYPNGFDVFIDDVAMWNEALSASTIASHVSTSYGLTNIPEPATMILLTLGGVAAMIRRRVRA